PIATPVAVSVVEPVVEDNAFAIPKSVTTTRPRLPSSRMLSGFTSRWMIPNACAARSEEHTSELQSRFDLVCRLLLEKKKKKHNNPEFRAESCPLFEHPTELDP